MLTKKSAKVEQIFFLVYTCWNKRKYAYKAINTCALQSSLRSFNNYRIGMEWEKGLSWNRWQSNVFYTVSTSESSLGISSNKLGKQECKHSQGEELSHSTNLGKRIDWIRDLGQYYLLQRLEKVKEIKNSWKTCWAPIHSTHSAVRAGRAQICQTVGTSGLIWTLSSFSLW